MTRSQLQPMPEYFDRYINQTDDVTLIEALKISLHELENPPLDKWIALGDQVYAPGKWTLKDMLQHMVDTERVFSYRANAFARGEKNVMPFDEELYAQLAEANRRSLDEILAESIAVRKATIYQFQSYNETMLQRKGISFKGEYSVQDIGFIIPGHQRWHLKVLEERYFPLLG